MNNTVDKTKTKTKTKHRNRRKLVTASSNFQHS